jgi:sirohydrochlorin cobaltochelatase
MSTPGIGIVLFAHGSRDPLWRKPMESVAERIQTRSPQTQVRCAYLELTTPDLPTAVAELAATGVSSISVLPLFLGVGKHAREDLPQLMGDLVQRYPSITFSLQPAVGEDSRLLDLMADIALS